MVNFGLYLVPILTKSLYISKSSKIKICTENIFPRVILERFRMAYFKKKFNHGEEWLLSNVPENREGGDLVDGWLILFP